MALSSISIAFIVLAGIIVIGLIIAWINDFRYKKKRLGRNDPSEDFREGEKRLESTKAANMDDYKRTFNQTATFKRP